MHENELWQKFDMNGERIPGGYSSFLGQPKDGEEYAVGSVLVWIYRHANDGVEVLFQKRSPYVSHHPDKWDVAVGGHINDGEKTTDAALRESSEEIGAKLDPENLRYVFSTLAVDGVNLYIHNFVYDYSDQSEDFKFNDQEVTELKWVPFSDFDSFIDKHAKGPLKNAKFSRELAKLFIEKYGNS